MSTQASAASAASGPPDDPQALQEEIERTREHLGQTVEALVAKADVKARAQDEAGRLVGRLKAKAALARQQATAQGRHVRRQVADKTTGPRQQAVTAAESVSNATPDPVKSAARTAAGAARRHRLPLAGVIGAVVASVLAWLLIRRRRQM